MSRRIDWLRTHRELQYLRAAYRPRRHLSRAALARRKAWLDERRQKMRETP